MGPCLPRCGSGRARLHPARLRLIPEPGAQLHIRALGGSGLHTNWQPPKISSVRGVIWTAAPVGNAAAHPVGVAARTDLRPATRTAVQFLRAHSRLGTI
jgi:hypothetical protein